MDRWADWYAKHRTFVRKSACILLGNARHADDVVQEVFLRLSQSASRYRGESSETTYLWGVTRNVCREFVRREIRERKFHENLQREHAPETGNTSTAVHEQADEAQLLSEGLSRLRPRHREPLLLYYYHDRSYAEIAKVLGIPEGTVKSRIHQARERLAAVLGEKRYHQKQGDPS